MSEDRPLQVLPLQPIEEPEPPPQPAASGVERFAPADLLALRQDLRQGGADSFQSADMVAGFLISRGYGVDADEARGAAATIEAAGCTVERMQRALERVARVA